MCIKSAKIFSENNYPQYPHFLIRFGRLKNVDMFVYITLLENLKKTREIIEFQIIFGSFDIVMCT